MSKKTACFFLFCFLVTGPARAQTVDCLVAVVSGQAVTLTDLEIAREFGFFDRTIEGTSGDRRLAVLDALIGQKVVLGVTREPLAIGKDEVSLALEALRERLGPAIFRTKLGKFGLREEDLRPYLEEQLRYDRVVSVRFGPKSPVSRGDAEKYYRDVYIPEQKAKGLEPDTLESVLSSLERRIRENLKARKVADWVRNLRSQAEVRINLDCLK
jgi:hypothetical protein